MQKNNDLNTSSAILKNHERVKQAALSLLSESKMPSTIGIGVELEFFLREKKENRFVSLEESQLFLDELSKLPGWSIFLRNEQSGRILRVSKSVDKVRYHSVKYEHPPHMMEIAIGYQNNLHELRTTLNDLLKELEVAASAANVTLDISARTEAPIISWSDVNEIEERFESISLSRRKIFGLQSDTQPDERIDFTTFTAATQFHLGGIRWWEQDDKYLERIYHAEFLISGLAFQGNKNLFFERWNAYRYVFGSMVLLGFPELNSWTMKNWIDGLLKSPYFKDDAFCFDDIISSLSELELKTELKNVRDLQIVKPKWIGTLEFRSDSATRDIEKILQMAAMRLAVYIGSLDSDPVNAFATSKFSELSKRWWNGEFVTELGAELVELKAFCFGVLKNRNLGEEIFL